MASRNNQSAKNINRRTAENNGENNQYQPAWQSLGGYAA